MLPPMEKHSESLNMRVSVEWLERIDAWRNAQIIAPSRSEAIRIMVDRFIAANAPREKVPTE